MTWFMGALDFCKAATERALPNRAREDTQFKVGDAECLTNVRGSILPFCTWSCIVAMQEIFENKMLATIWAPVSKHRGSGLVQVQNSRLCHIRLMSMQGLKVIIKHANVNTTGACTYSSMYIGVCALSKAGSQNWRLSVIRSLTSYRYSENKSVPKKHLQNAMCW